MGTRGPQPTPTEVLRQRGSWRAKRKPDGSADSAPEGTPRCPSWLDAEGKAEWRRTCKALKAMGLLSPLYGSAMAMLCQSWSTFVRVSSELNTLDDSQDARGRVLQGVVGTSHRAYVRMSREFGLTPLSRSRVQVKVPKPALKVHGKGRFFSDGA